MALLIHLADDGHGPVGAQPLEKAIKWGAYLETHARRVFASAANPDIRTANALSRKILSKVLEDGFSLRDVYRPCWTGLTSKQDAARAVGLLVDLDWLLEVKEPTGGAPRTTYKINPRIWGMPVEGTDKTDRSPLEPLLSVVSVADGGRSESSATETDSKIEEANRLVREAFEEEAFEEDAPEEMARWTA